MELLLMDVTNMVKNFTKRKHYILHRVNAQSSYFSEGCATNGAHISSLISRPPLHNHTLNIKTNIILPFFILGLKIIYIL